MTLQGQINGIYKITRKETGEHTKDNKTTMGESVFLSGPSI